MRVRLCIWTDSQRRQDVLVDCHESATVGDLAAQVARVLRLSDLRGLWLDGVRLVDTATLGSSVLLDGSMVAIAADIVVPDFESELEGWQLRLVSGPDAGAMIDLPQGRHQLGRQPGGALHDPAVSRNHAAITVTAADLRICDLGSANGTTVDGQPVEVASGVTLVSGQTIRIGNTLAAVAWMNSTRTRLELGAAGTRNVARPPRLLPASSDVVIGLPSPPKAPVPRRLPTSAMAIPLVLGLVMGLVLRQPLFVMFALASPLIAGASAVGDRRTTTKDHRAATAEYNKKSAAADQQLCEALAAETRKRRDEHPDPAVLLLTATQPGERLWERRRADADALSFRFGTADLPALLRVEHSSNGSFDRRDPLDPVVHDVPVAVNLRDIGILGISGPEAVVDGVLRWLIIQLATLHSPQDLALTLLTQPSRATWSWFAWLPHARVHRDTDLVSIGNDDESVCRRIGELNALIMARRDDQPGATPASTPAAQVVLIDRARSFHQVPGFGQLLRDGPAVGVYCVCLDSSAQLLPEECTAVARVSDDDPAFLDFRSSGSDVVAGILADQVTAAYADRVARALAPLRDMSLGDNSEVQLPDAVRLLDVLGLESPTAASVRAGWRRRPASTTCTIGVGAAGPVTVDLSRDGPHALVAGTTGSGKSELLQSIVASLAVVNRSDALNFVLIDYKGGSAFKDCARLPHTVGMVTDLDPHLVERAIVSLTAELKQRERLLAAAGAKDLDDYQRLVDGDASLPRLARLVLIVDEFAALARELPAFVSGLVNLAQRGRSLGIHLILATQRPGGVVSPEIRANSNLRIALRMTDTAESVDVIDVADAARISATTPGRAYVRVGHSSLTLFQSGRIGGRRPGAVSQPNSVPTVSRLDWATLGQPPICASSLVAVDESAETDLSVLIGAITQAALIETIPEQSSPWLQPLPPTLSLEQLNQLVDVDGRSTIPYGLEDLPAEQRQRPAGFDLSDGHLLVIGSSRSGRSQLLRTIAGSAASRHAPSDVQLYGLDCGNGALLPISALPHCGAVVSRTDVERCGRLLLRFARELERRQGLFARAGHADISEHRRADSSARLPHLLLLVDGWEGFGSSLGDVDGGRMSELILTLLREGAAAGLHLIISGDRSLGTGRIGALVDQKLALRLADRADYVFLGLNPRQLPENIPPGRGFRSNSGTAIQIALLDEADGGQAQARALARIGERARQQWPIIRPAPFRIDPLPARLSLAEIGDIPRRSAGLLAVAGVGGDELTVLGPDLLATTAFVVAGPGRSGRSSAMQVMAQSVLAVGVEVLVAAPRESQLRQLVRLPGVRGVITDQAASLDEWRSLVGRREERHLVVIIDDAELLRDCPAADLLRQLAKGDARLATSLILGGDSGGLCAGISNWQSEAKRARQGLLLSPQSGSDGDLFGARLPRSAVGAPIQPGRGCLHLGDGRVVTVTVPLPRG